MEINVTTLIGGLAGILTSSAALPQLIKIIKERKVEGISPVMLIMVSTGTALWTYYGFILGDLPLIFTNAFATFLNGSSLLLQIKITKERRRSFFSKLARFIKS